MYAELGLPDGGRRRLRPLILLALSLGIFWIFEQGRGAGMLTLRDREITQASFALHAT